MTFRESLNGQRCFKSVFGHILLPAELPLACRADARAVLPLSQLIERDITHGARRGQRLGREIDRPHLITALQNPFLPHEQNGRHGTGEDRKNRDSQESFEQERAGPRTEEEANGYAVYRESCSPCILRTAYSVLCYGRAIRRIADPHPYCRAPLV